VAYGSLSYGGAPGREHRLLFAGSIFFRAGPAMVGQFFYGHGILMGLATGSSFLCHVLSRPLLNVNVNYFKRCLSCRSVFFKFLTWHVICKNINKAGDFVPEVTIGG